MGDGLTNKFLQDTQAWLNGFIVDLLWNFQMCIATCEKNESKER